MLLLMSMSVCQHSSNHPPADPLSATKHSLWLLHVSGIPCHPVFGQRRRWLPSVCISPVCCVISSLTLNTILELSFCTVPLHQFLWQHHLNHIHLFIHSFIHSLRNQTRITCWDSITSSTVSY